MTRVYMLDHPHDLAPDDLRMLVGGKAANLNTMATRLGLPVPPGFVVTTQACTEVLAAGWPDGLDDEIRAHVARLEERTGRRFGDPSDPLLVSVRSGAPVSMPGMMDTILNLGLNEATTAGLATASSDAAFAADCLRRFRVMYHDIVGSEPPVDPWEQLRGAIVAVFRSWNSDRARAYRQREHIPDNLGTAVTVQAMVFGNRGRDSGTGVLFTRNPATGERELFGDILFGAQGEDVVAGTHRTEPLAVLDERLPAVAGELRGYAASLERHYADLCDIEFTIEQGRLWMLQVRVGKRSPRAALRMAVDMAEDPDFPLDREAAVRRVAGLLLNPPHLEIRGADVPAPLAVGLPASPGVGCGRIVTSTDAALAEADQGHAVILVRSETSPDDVPGMARSAGILTTRGGLASHAAVVARGWGIPAVVGASTVQVDGDRVLIGGRTLGTGAVITVDGSTGEVFAGEIAGRRIVVPEAAVLLGWARELGVSLDDGTETPTGSGPAIRAGAAGAMPSAGAPHATSEDDVIRTLLVKGHAQPEALATVLRVPVEAATSLAGELVRTGVAEKAPAGLRLTGAGRLRALALFDADRARAGGEQACLAALDQFLSLDRRIKETITAWQLREVDGEQFANDHSDTEYDAAVLTRLSRLHDDTVAWLAPLTEQLTRFDTYRDRLQHALDLALSGDRRYVASPLVDSYHGVWFELHEDLIRLAGRRRSDEAATARA